MLKVRIIPCLQLIDQSLVKTVKFKKHGYIGDPINTVRIFNELEVDELCFLDIRATVDKRQPNFQVLHEIADECFMPLSYGGAVKDVATALRVLSIGFEKIVINTAAVENPLLITEIAEKSGVQSVVASIDAKKSIWGTYQVFSHDGTRKFNIHPVEWAQKLEALGAGELLVTSMDRDGTWSGFETELLKEITSNVTIPVIANGGAGSISHIQSVIKEAKVSAVALGSIVVYQAKDLGVLVNFPDKTELEKSIYESM